MKNSIIIQIFSVLIILISCQEKKEKQISVDENISNSKVINSSIKTDSVTPEQRISDIKNWYNEAQNNMKSADKNCKKAEEKWVHKIDKELSIDFDSTVETKTVQLFPEKIRETKLEVTESALENLLDGELIVIEYFLSKR